MSDAVRRVRAALKADGKVANEELASTYFDVVQEITRRMNAAKLEAVRETEKPFLDELREVEEEYAIMLKLSS